MLCTSTTVEHGSHAGQAVDRGPPQHFRRVVGMQLFDRQTDDKRGSHHHESKPGERKEDSSHCAERMDEASSEPAGSLEHGRCVH